ncbi:hypothetical protein LR48_Vigan03g239400 [Vigna angularis]|uniref:Uncharacterized protein n=2 Tax=Phaseolus angularis TaxID=3914 RepID=A0A0L9U8P9_PHAAN|nr:uncharacterized protein HKW66_Vig0054210 [Vigna angularis]KOM39012.1 hypothetical protein LR48_Vigan03g239400 [Vigna angularis]BAT85831.1 hypothetical protein VIGAN_04342500 [Vigna angularis var. angularis]
MSTIYSSSPSPSPPSSQAPMPPPPPFSSLGHSQSRRQPLADTAATSNPCQQLAPTLLLGFCSVFAIPIKIVIPHNGVFFKVSKITTMFRPK